MLLGKQVRPAAKRHRMARRRKSHPGITQGGPSLARWGGTPCPYCNNEMHLMTERRPTVDHVVSRKLGGTRADANTLIVCAPCNQDKADQSLSEWIARLRERGDARAETVTALIAKRWPQLAVCR